MPRPEDGCREQRPVGRRSARARCRSSSRRRPACTRSARRSSKPTSRRCSTSTSSSCARRCRRARRRATRSSRTSERSASKGPFNAVPSKDSPSRKAIFICQPASAAEETACARRIITNLATTAFRRPATAADVDPLMEFYQAGRKGGDFDAGIEHALARILASPKFIYRIEAEPGRDGPNGRGAGGAGLSHQRPRSGLAAVVLPLEPRPRRRSC